jgi:hypothetical protein
MFPAWVWQGDCAMSSLAFNARLAMAFCHGWQNWLQWAFVRLLNNWREMAMTATDLANGIAAAWQEKHDNTSCA